VIQKFLIVLFGKSLPGATEFLHGFAHLNSTLNSELPPLCIRQQSATRSRFAKSARFKKKHGQFHTRACFKGN
jgi:hypothetical protein